MPCELWLVPDGGLESTVTQIWHGVCCLSFLACITLGLAPYRSAWQRKGQRQMYTVFVRFQSPPTPGALSAICVFLERPTVFGMRKKALQRADEHQE